jgi:hypothetical protein
MLAYTIRYELEQRLAPLLSPLARFDPTAKRKAAS